MIPSEPQQPSLWFMDYNRKGRNPFIDDVDVAFLLTICVLAVMGFYAAQPIEGNLAGQIARFVKWIDAMLSSIPTIIGFVLSGLACIGLRVFWSTASHQETPVETREGMFRSVSPSDWRRYRATATGMRSLVSTFAPPDWLFIAGSLLTVLMVICSRYSHGEWEMLGVPINLRGIFNTVGPVAGYVGGALSGLIVCATVLNMLYGGRSVSTWTRADRRHIVAGAAMGGAIGALLESQKPKSERHYAPAVVTGAATGGAVVAGWKLLPDFLAFAVAVGLGCLAGVLGFFAVGLTIGAIVVAYIVVLEILCTFVVFTAMLWTLRIVWRVGMQILRGGAIVIKARRLGWRTTVERVGERWSEINDPPLRSWTRLLIGADWVLVSRETGRWKQVWMDWDRPGPMTFERSFLAQLVPASKSSVP